MKKKKSILDRFLEFKGRHNLTTATLQKMFQEYANSGPDKARTYFTHKYGISEHVFYRARDFVVICMLLDAKTTNRIFAKAAFTSGEHGSAKRSQKHSQNLKLQREEFFSTFTQADIEDILHKYAEGLALEKIAVTYDTGTWAIKVLLKKGLLLGYADQNTYALIDQRVTLLGRSISEIYKKANKQADK